MIFLGWKKENRSGLHRTYQMQKRFMPSFMKRFTGSLAILSVDLVAASDTMKKNIVKSQLPVKFWLFSRWILLWFHLISAHNMKFSMKIKLWLTTLASRTAKFLSVRRVITACPSQKSFLGIL